MSVDTDVGTLGALRALAEPLRWRIVELLADEELCVCHIVDELGVAQPLVSHHLRILRAAGLVDTERYRYWTYYRLRADARLRCAIAWTTSSRARRSRVSGGGPVVEVTDVRPELWRRLLAGYVGTAFLVAVGSGIAAQALSPADTGLQLFENAAATAAALVALILALGPVSGGHFNRVVTIADAVFGGLAARDVAGYVTAQVAGAVMDAPSEIRTRCEACGAAREWHPLRYLILVGPRAEDRVNQLQLLEVSEEHDDPAESAVSRPLYDVAADQERAPGAVYDPPFVAPEAVVFVDVRRDVDPCAREAGVESADTFDDGFTADESPPWFDKLAVLR